MKAVFGRIESNSFLFHPKKKIAETIFGHFYAGPSVHFLKHSFSANYEIMSFVSVILI